MKISQAWLSDLIDLPWSGDELGRQLTAIGLEHHPLPGSPMRPERGPVPDLHPAGPGRVQQRRGERGATDSEPAGPGERTLQRAPVLLDVPHAPDGTGLGG